MTMPLWISLILPYALLRTPHSPNELCSGGRELTWGYDIVFWTKAKIWDVQAWKQVYHSLFLLHIQCPYRSTTSFLTNLFASEHMTLCIEISLHLYLDVFVCFFNVKCTHHWTQVRHRLMSGVSLLHEACMSSLMQAIPVSSPFH